MNETQTPRTDAAESNWWSEDGLRSAFIVRADFARELERENAILTAERDEARRLYCRAVEEIEHGMTNETERMVADYLGWDCFNDNKNA